MSGLTRADIDDILRLIDGSDFDELKLEMGDTKIELRRRGASAPAPVAPTAAAAQASAPAPAPAPAPAAAVPGTGQAVPAPLLGTFYRAPKPGADPFIQVGDTVTPETVIGIIEVMKLMNQVEAGIAGTVTEIIAPDGELVEHGQPLVRVQPD
ncbi:acetyl-CoA carboxylase biotin carboxyl carrier protein [Mesobacterium pallidum]|uniref:acetyl-CoA carboxylase biotin carboxyl carrier protein n=1 Tax=Mesobacterium pallidum TaxID=2872037 RepID=UPI001EE3331E|nr:acetyl-CoA carboxylase biotin carboxyl carrier protein [Mesobacterium pallidum]